VADVDLVGSIGFQVLFLDLLRLSEGLCSVALLLESGEEGRVCAGTRGDQRRRELGKGENALGKGDRVVGKGATGKERRKKKAVPRHITAEIQILGGVLREKAW
jgi:hypothetical protein